MYDYDIDGKKVLKSWEDFVSKGFIEYLDVEEEEISLIAMDLEALKN